MRDRIRAAWRSRSDPLGFRDIRRWIAGVAERSGVAAGEAHALSVAANEMCANVHRHAYGGSRDGPLDLTIDVGPDRIVVTVGHEGAPFDPERYVPPDLSRPAERGYGMFLVSRLVDTIRFVRKAKGTSVVLMKRRTSARAEAPAGQGER